MVSPSAATGDAPCPNCGNLLWFTESAGLDEIFGLRRFLISDASIVTKEQLFQWILDRLVESGALLRDHRDGVLAALLRREELGSTGIGRGVAMPHAKYPNLGQISGAFVEIPAGIDFDSLDRQPVTRLCLIVSPADRPGDHLRVLQLVSRHLREG